jgi:ABC-2 type transport system permease protein
VIAGTVRSEFLKLLTTPTPRRLLVTSVVVSIVMASAIGFGTSEADMAATDGVRSVLASGGITAGILALILGILASGGEYRYGTITPTWLTNPKRTRVVLAQMTAHGIAGLSLGLSSTAAAVAVGLASLNARGIDVGLSVGQLAAILGGGILFAGLSGAFGSALGSLFANPVVAVTLVLLVLFGVEPLLTGLIDGYQEYSLTGVRVALSGGSAQAAGDPTGGLPSIPLATTLWVSYTTILTMLALTAVRRREIT